MPQGDDWHDGWMIDRKKRGGERSRCDLGEEEEGLLVFQQNPHGSLLHSLSVLHSLSSCPYSLFSLFLALCSFKPADRCFTVN